MDATSLSSYDPSSVSDNRSDRIDGTQASPNDLEALFGSMLDQSKSDGSGSSTRDQLEDALRSLLSALEGASNSGSPSAPTPDGGSTPSGSGGPGGVDAAGPTGGSPSSGPAAPSSTATADPAATASSMPTEAVQPSSPSQVSNSDMSAGKTQVYDALKQQGATPQEIAQVMGSGMVETNDFNADQRDTSKDGTASENYSAFNLNAPELKALGYNGDPSALNNQDNIGQAADLLLNGIRQDGFNDVAGMTRDSVNFDPNSSDIQQWDAERSADANQLLQLYQQEGTQAFTDNERVASYSQHI